MNTSVLAVVAVAVAVDVSRCRISVCCCSCSSLVAIHRRRRRRCPHAFLLPMMMDLVVRDGHINITASLSTSPLFRSPISLPRLLPLPFVTIVQTTYVPE